MAQQILLRRDTAAQWTSVNPTLAEGEIAVETDTLKLKVGTGLLAWNSLPYVSGGEGGTSNHSLLLNLSADDHTQYHTDARGDARYVGLSDARLTNARTPTEHDHVVADITDFPAQASEAELLAGAETALRSFSPADLVTAIDEHAPAEDFTPIPSYTETGATLTFVAEASGDIEIPCDGKVYQLTITGDCSLVTGTVPTAPECGSTLVYVLIDTETPPVIATDATWNWPDSTATDLPTADEARAELVLNTSPQGWVVARVTEIGVPT
jgi:hypothetical protein